MVPTFDVGGADSIKFGDVTYVLATGDLVVLLDNSFGHDTLCDFDILSGIGGRRLRGKRYAVILCLCRAVSRLYVGSLGIQFGVMGKNGILAHHVA